MREMKGTVRCARQADPHSQTSGQIVAPSLCPFGFSPFDWPHPSLWQTVGVGWGPSCFCDLVGQKRKVHRVSASTGDPAHGLVEPQG